jgi:flagellar hook assembly protein FlgD
MALGWIRVGVILGCVGAATLVAGAPATAAAPVTITSPGDGTSHAAGYTGPLGVDFTGGDLGSYTLSIAGPSGYSWQTSWNDDGGQATNSWSFRPAWLAGTYQVTVTAPDSSVAASASFVVDPAVLASSVAPSSFYPLEADGFRDVARFSFRTNAVAADTVRVVNAIGRTIRIKHLGALTGSSAHSWVWGGRKDGGERVQPGVFHIHLVAMTDERKLRGPIVAVRVRALLPRIARVSVAPSPFFPIEHDGYRDSTTFTFSTNVRAADTVRVRAPSGRIIRIAALGVLKGHGRVHAWVWNGDNNAGTVMRPGKYKIKVVSVYYGQKAVSPWRLVVLKRKPSSGGGGGGGGGAGCTAGYSPCLADHGGADYDCYGGSGNGPYFTKPGVVYRVTGSDPYGLDADGDGLGCEQQ